RPASRGPASTRGDADTSKSLHSGALSPKVAAASRPNSAPRRVSFMPRSYTGSSRAAARQGVEVALKRAVGRAHADAGEAHGDDHEAVGDVVPELDARADQAEVEHAAGDVPFDSDHAVEHHYQLCVGLAGRERTLQEHGQ